MIYDIMKRNITFFLFWKSGISLFICLILLTSCDLDTPESPNRTHPFDSYNPETHGDPFQLKAELVPEGVRLTWQPVEWPILISINILRQVDDEEFQTLDIVRATDTTYFDEDISNSHRYTYFIVGIFDLYGNCVTAVNPAIIYSTPSIVIEADPVIYTPSRDVSIRTTAFEAEKIVLSNTVDFADAAWEDFAHIIQWTLATGPGIKTVYARIIFTPGDTSEVISDSIYPMPINPVIEIEDPDGDGCTAYRQVDLNFNGNGDNLQIQLSEEPEFENVDWTAYSPSARFELSTGQNVKILYARIRNDFEIISEVVSDSIRPAIMTPAISINEGEEFTPDLNLRLSMPGVSALEMQVSEAEDFSDSNWEAYAQECPFILTPGDGIRTVYARFRNEFYETDAATDEIAIDTQTEIESFTWTSDHGNPHYVGDIISFELKMSDDAAGAETGGSATVSIPDVVQNHELNDAGNGYYTGRYTVRSGDYIHNGLLTVNFTDRAGNIAEGMSNDPIYILAHQWDFVLTGTSHLLLVQSAAINDIPLEPGDEIGVFTPGNLCAGAVTVRDVGYLIGFAANGDDETTDEIDGFRENEAMSFRFWDADQELEIETEAFMILEGDLEFRVDGVTVFSLRGEGE